ncbi:hypothetical protein J6590_034839 [Homalodisca vitripennis]|nr:hypothetical protein J6590_034839 [Homalodisca vitripennis]
MNDNYLSLFLIGTDRARLQGGVIHGALVLAGRSRRTAVLHVDKPEASPVFGNKPITISVRRNYTQTRTTMKRLVFNRIGHDTMTAIDTVGPSLVYLAQIIPEPQLFVIVPPAHARSHSALYCATSLSPRRSSLTTRCLFSSWQPDLCRLHSIVYSTNGDLMGFY